MKEVANQLSHMQSLIRKESRYEDADWILAPLKFQQFDGKGNPRST
jgi:hypothetical protein